MYRWATCPGSVKLSENVPKQSSSYADEGTSAHFLAAHCLAEKLLAGSLVGAKMTDDKGTKFTVTAEMADAVETYLDAVHDAAEKGCKLHIEESFDLSKVHPGCFGTADAVIWNPKTKLLTVMDYKHGAGIPVNVRGNPQLRYYALGALLSLGYPAAKVKMVIVQPRCDHSDGPVREETIDALDLLDFCADLVKYAKATEEPNAKLYPGEHCRFCPAGKANACPEVKNKAQAIAKTVFTPALAYDPEELRRCLDARETVKAWLKNLDEFAYAEAEAGRCPPGYKLVDKQGRRKWREGAEDELILAAKGDDWFEPRQIKSPAQLEKVKTAGKALVAQYTITESSGHVLVPEDDKRPAVTRISAQDAFTPSIEDLIKS